MRQEQGVALLVQQQRGQLTAKILSKLLLEDLARCGCKIYGKNSAEKIVLLAELKLLPDSLFYEMFDQRIEFTVVGDIINNQYVPLTYQVTGQKYSFYGRCSVIRKVCGVDLYLSKTYTEILGDTVKQRFSISIKKLLKTTHKSPPL